MKFLRIIIPVLIAAVLLIACNKKTEVTVINVLDKNMHEDCHIPGSVQVDLDKLDAFAKDLDKSKPVITYCANYACSASGYAAKKLAEMGFTKVYAYEAGIADWHSKGYPVNGSCKESYLTMDNEPLEGHTIAAGYNVISTEELASMLNIRIGCKNCACPATH